MVITIIGSKTNSTINKDQKFNILKYTCINRQSKLGSPFVRKAIEKVK